jgi:hypothetical protein
MISQLKALIQVEAGMPSVFVAAPSPHFQHVDAAGAAAPTRMTTKSPLYSCPVGE